MSNCEAGSDCFSSQKASRYIHDFHVHEVKFPYTSLLDLCTVIQAECSLCMSAIWTFPCSEYSCKFYPLLLAIVSWTHLCTFQIFCCLSFDANCSRCCCHCNWRKRHTVISIWSVHSRNHLKSICTFPPVLFDRALLHLTECFWNSHAALSQDVWSRSSSHRFQKL